ncbi:MAG TPA: ceramidase domain-containing protein [Chitinophagales bacterium]|nr:ceramidase domain-containing protein [Chitinophagales bacterium]HMW13124.1 ceramidase domain-containing protein [Chitinophagales bacterium]HMX61098.1 ceramidase domain-containing protein [Chitinophagales bacterium]HMY23520.1 ceramidase domain-containing protein [Chitinophagales bacterium]HMZ33582.1 ceramidase domain-containing protein [Chitinophagales bacterium]
MPILDFDKFKEDFNLFNHKKRVFTQPFFGTIIIAAGLFILYKLNQYVDPWASWRQALGNATHFCEMNRFDQLIVQPSNTWSNLGYIIVGLIFLSIAKNDHKYEHRKQVNNVLAKFPGFTYLIGFSVLYLGLGSFLYHATLTYFFQKLDQTGMYFILVSFIAYVLFKLFPQIKFRGKIYVSNTFFMICAIIVQLLFFFFLWKLPINILFPALTISFFTINFLLIAKMRNSVSMVSLMKASLVSILIAASIWILDITDKLCSPTSIFQGHALWHILGALSIFLGYLYYRSETFLTPEEQEVTETI